MLAAAFVGAIGCSADTGLLDRGDAGTTIDAAPVDTGVNVTRDSGPGFIDVGAPDARPDTGDGDDPDAGFIVPDSGLVEDSGVTPDAGPPPPDSGCSGPTVNVQFTGTITLVSDSDNLLGGTLGSGASVTGSYTFDPTVPDSNADSTVGDYWHSSACYGMAVVVAGIVVQTDTTNVSYLFEFVDRAERDNIVMHSYNNLDLIQANGRSLHVRTISWQLDDPSSTALASDALLAAPPILSQWTQPFGLTFTLEDPNDPSRQALVRGVVEAAF